MKYKDPMSGRFIYWGDSYWYHEDDGLYRDKKVYVKLPNDKKSEEELHNVITTGNWRTYTI